MSNQTCSSGGPGLCGILTIIFVIAKLMGVISWSWWVVFAPAIFGFSMLLLILGFALVVAGLAMYFGTK